LEWNPPGHGDIYTALQTSGLLEKLTAEGMTYAFIANADNLGATMDLSLLGYFATHGFPMMMEVARRTPADTKGGHLARRKDGRLLLREIAQCPKADLQRFQDIDRYRFFNTNSIWLNLHALRDRIRENPVIHLPLILNPKTVDPRDKTSPAVYQIETAMGSAISLFGKASAVNVPMQRFSPVKKTSDLLALRSDGYAFATDGTLTLSPERTTGRIQIQLDNRFYGKIDDFERHFAKGIPSLIHCERLEIEGDVYFEKEIAIRGCVRIRNPHDKPATIPAGTIIDGDLTF
jgi:UTP--glucose-1-phosphate uridylyltransferase